jgi:hypothetical protein
LQVEVAVVLVNQVEMLVVAEQVVIDVQCLANHLEVVVLPNLHFLLC